MQLRSVRLATASVHAAVMNIRRKSPSQKMELLRSLPAFGARSDRELEDLARLVDEVDVAEGTTLISQGEIGQEAFVIVEGWAAVTVHGEPVAALGPGEFVGEVAMLDHGRRTASVIAKTPMRLLAIGPAAFATFVDRPRVGVAMAKELANRLRLMDETLINGDEPGE
jgi:CRP-like cAMP-binding protein